MTKRDNLCKEKLIKLFELNTRYNIRFIKDSLLSNVKQANDEIASLHIGPKH